MNYESPHNSWISLFILYLHYRTAVNDSCSKYINLVCVLQLVNLSVNLLVNLLLQYNCYFQYKFSYDDTNDFISLSILFTYYLDLI